MEKMWVLNYLKGLVNCLVTIYFVDKGYIPEKSRAHILWAHTDGKPWPNPGMLWPETNEWYKDMKIITGVEPRDGSFKDFQRIFKYNDIWAVRCNSKGIQFLLTCSY